jgi:hypothetical protein
MACVQSDKYDFFPVPNPHTSAPDSPAILDPPINPISPVHWRVIGQVNNHCLHQGFSTLTPSASSTYQHKPAASLIHWQLHVCIMQCVEKTTTLCILLSDNENLLPVDFRCLDLACHLWPIMKTNSILIYTDLSNHLVMKGKCNGWGFTQPYCSFGGDKITVLLGSETVHRTNFSLKKTNKMAHLP